MKKILFKFPSTTILMALLTLRLIFLGPVWFSIILGIIGFLAFYKPLLMVKDLNSGKDSLLKKASDSIFGDKPNGVHMLKINSNVLRKWAAVMDKDPTKPYRLDISDPDFQTLLEQKLIKSAGFGTYLTTDVGFLVISQLADEISKKF